MISRHYRLLFLGLLYCLLFRRTHHLRDATYIIDQPGCCVVPKMAKEQFTSAMTMYLRMLLGKKTRVWGFTAQIITTPAENVNPPIPLDVDNGLPGIELWFGKSTSTKIGLLCRLDSCDAMNIGNLRVYK